MTSAKKTIFSGIQPSGSLHIGNYLGAIRQWVDMQDEYKSIFCVVDYHAITVRQDPEELKRNIITTAKVYLAAGIDPKKSVIFQQSDVSAHTELAWILNTITRMSDLYKMTQFKDKTKIDYEGIFQEIQKIIQEINKRIFTKGDIQIISSKISDQLKELKEQIREFIDSKSGVGLIDYPVLMASDILLYNTDVVPVGEDQKQHVELARDLAKRFNHYFGETFQVPEVKVRKKSARIMGLDDATNKMSKSAPSAMNYIGLTDKSGDATRKIMRAETDSGQEITEDKDGKPGISNLLTIYSLLTDQSIKDLEKQYRGKGYGDFKKDLAGVTERFLAGFREKFDAISDQEARKILEKGAEKVRPVAEKTLATVKKRIGIK